MIEKRALRATPKNNQKKGTLIMENLFDTFLLVIFIIYSMAMINNTINVITSNSTNSNLQGKEQQKETNLMNATTESNDQQEEEQSLASLFTTYENQFKVIGTNPTETNEPYKNITIAKMREFIANNNYQTKIETIVGKKLYQLKKIEYYQALQKI